MTEKQKFNELNDKIIKLSREISALIESSDEKTKKEKKLEELNEELKQLKWLDFYPSLDIPTHLKDFATFQIKHWIESGLGAMCAYQKDCHYHVDEKMGKIVQIDCDKRERFKKRWCGATDWPKCCK